MSAGTLQYSVGQVLLWHRDGYPRPPERVTVVALRSRGQARLSNGWTVDEDGYAEGTTRVPGGHVEPAP